MPTTLILFMSAIPSVFLGISTLAALTPGRLSRHEEGNLPWPSELCVVQGKIMNKALHLRLRDNLGKTSDINWQRP